MFRFARIKTPWLKNSFTSWFVATYKVNLSEAERENVKDYFAQAGLITLVSTADLSRVTLTKALRAKCANTNVP